MIAAVVVGGVAIFGGSGSVLGAALGRAPAQHDRRARSWSSTSRRTGTRRSRARCCSARSRSTASSACASRRRLRTRRSTSLSRRGRTADRRPASTLLQRAAWCAGRARSSSLLLGTIALGDHLSPAFLESDNFFYLGLNVGEVAIMALPLALIVITGEIDLSVASMLGLARHVLAELYSHGWSIWLGDGRHAGAAARLLRRSSTACSSPGRAAVAGGHDRHADALPRHRPDHPARTTRSAASRRR